MELPTIMYIYTIFLPILCITNVCNSIIPFDSYLSIYLQTFLKISENLIIRRKTSLCRPPRAQMTPIKKAPRGVSFLLAAGAPKNTPGMKSALPVSRRGFVLARKKLEANRSGVIRRGPYVPQMRSIRSRPPE